MFKEIFFKMENSLISLIWKKTLAFIIFKPKRTILLEQYFMEITHKSFKKKEKKL